MRSFTLDLESDGFEETKQIQFEADDPGRVFTILEREGRGKSATLSESGRRLGVLRRADTGYWQFTP